MLHAIHPAKPCYTPCFFLVYLYFTDLTIERFCMTGGKSPIGYLKAYMTNLYLSKDSQKVTEAIEEGRTSCVLLNLQRMSNVNVKDHNLKESETWH